MVTNNKFILDLKEFMDQARCNFLAVQAIAERLVEAGFRELDKSDVWNVSPGDRCFVTQNDSAIFAFVVGEDIAENGFNIISAHSDSPGFRIKPHCEMPGKGGTLRLNTEVYGGPILYTWFDRPLSISGRVCLKGEDVLKPVHKFYKSDRPLLVIPHLAIHFNRAVNEGNPLSKQKDMLPVMGVGMEDFKLKEFIASDMGCAPDDILDYDLTLYPVEDLSFVGVNESLMCSGRLDDLSMAHAACTALLEEASVKSCHTRVMAIFDNEETGSGTKQGAASPILDYILRRIVYCNGLGEQDYMMAVANSFMISADNAHGFHPNYPGKYDPTNHPVLGGGPCLKINANCKYMSDADSAAVFKSLCELAGVPCQEFVNHSDVAGGSTLGNILTSQIPLRGVDMGAPLWAMHSAVETASVEDHLSTIKVFRTFFRL